MKQTFYSNGKLLITGEYLVLDGANALALPTKFGQDFVVEPSNQSVIFWKSIDADGTIWFEANIAFDLIAQNLKTDNDPLRNTLIEILHTAYIMNPNFLQSNGYQITTKLTFPRFWGLGTSSTLINNIAQWLCIDAYQLLWKSFGGSGYDIACAKKNQPIIYNIANENPQVSLSNFKPKFINALYFVYLNHKQNSKAAIASYKGKKGNLAAEILMVNAITAAIQKTDDVKEFAQLLEQHESILSAILKLPTIKQTLFPDFTGTLKSLGAWGGDFILAVSENDPTEYFRSKGFDTVITYHDMIL